MPKNDALCTLVAPLKRPKANQTHLFSRPSTVARGSLACSAYHSTRAVRRRRRRRRHCSDKDASPAEAAHSRGSGSSSSSALTPVYVAEYYHHSLYPSPCSARSEGPWKGDKHDLLTVSEVPVSFFLRIGSEKMKRGEILPEVLERPEKAACAPLLCSTSTRTLL